MVDAYQPFVYSGTPFDIDQNKTKCSICGIDFTWHSELIQHMEENHSSYCQNTPQKPIFECDICSYKTHKRQHFVYHRRTHSGIKPFKCQYCPYSCTQEQGLISHLRKHTGEKPFKCPSCDYTAAHNTSIKTHIFRHHSA